ncbi:MAG TPA: hypothetical protein VMT24_05000 [Aggregatilineaceae bacterium]|nr:hypothetical protein [Aggregatilineaceae bacterium]
MTVVAAFDVPPLESKSGEVASTSDELERITLHTGNAILRGLMQVQWELF